MTARSVTYLIKKADDSPWANTNVSFKLESGGYTATTNYPPFVVPGVTDANGAGSVTLWANGEGATVTIYRAYLPDESFTFILPPGDTSVALTALRVDGDAPAGWNVTVQSLIDAHAAIEAADGTLGHVDYGSDAFETAVQAVPGFGPGFAADMATQAELDAEALARSNTDTSLSNAINNEATARSTGDATNATAISNEATARASADTAITNSLNAHTGDTNNPHAVTKSQVGLGSVLNAAPILAMFWSANGDIYFVAHQAMTFAASPQEAGTGTLTYFKALTATPTSFSSATLPITLAVGDVLKATCASISGYKSVTLTRSA